MANSSQNDEVSSSPFTRVFSRPETDQVINCALGLRDPIDVASLKSSLSVSAIATHPRFTSLLARHPTRWLKPTTPLNIHRHVITISDHHASINSYLSHLSSSPPMSSHKPLWELHAVMSVNCVVLRVHHAVGDGISLMAMLAACFGGEETAEKKSRSGRWRKRGVMGMVRSVFYTAKYEAELFGRIVGVVKDEKTVVSGGDGVEQWPREVVSVELDVEDVERVKKKIANATMNDVLMGVISSGLAKYLDIHSPKSMVKGIKITSLVLANMRRNSGLQDMPNLMKTGSGSGSGSGSSWGNKFGLFTVPIKCRQEHVHPLQHVTRMKSVMDRKKQSFEAHLLHSSLGSALSVLGPKMGSWFYKRVLHATTFLISNIVGPKEEISIASNPVTFIKLCISSLSQAMTLHLVSYNGRADLQISVAKDIIPDVNFLAKCFDEALLEMKNAANQDPIQ